MENGYAACRCEKRGDEAIQCCIIVTLSKANGSLLAVEQDSSHSLRMTNNWIATLR
jgi:hypothetical protein